MVRGVRHAHVHEGERLGAEFVEQQPRRDVGVVRLLLDQGARRHDEGRAHVLRRDAVVHVRARLGDDAPRIHVMQALAGLADQRFDAAHVEELAVRAGEGEAGHRRLFGTLPLRPDARAFLPVEHVVPRHLVLAGAHQRQLHLILDVLDVDRAAGREPPLEDAGHLKGQGRDLFADARGGRGRAALHREKGLRHRDFDLVVGVGRDRAVALDDAELPRRGGREGRGDRRDAWPGVGGAGGFRGGLCLHLRPSSQGCLLQPPASAFRASFLPRLLPRRVGDTAVEGTVPTAVAGGVTQYVVFLATRRHNIQGFGVPHKWKCGACPVHRG